ncbi:MAG: hypothetical protein MJE63_11365 [Proteobacteria bacterium]|nr:hypothetical protein [Pseudomonadota bacterium]
MNLERRKEILKKIYQIYDDFIKDYELACKKSCSGCCTRNVTMTSLEAYEIMDYLKENNRLDLIDRLKLEKGKKRFQPKVTINKLAEIYANDEPVPVEGDSDPFWGSCPILEDDACPIYEVRPFECRSMCSKEYCEEDGFADMDPFVLSVNNLFKQYIEHIDTFGVSGNLTDLIIYLEENENKEILRGSEEVIHPRLINNHPAKILTVPEEHQEKIKAIYKQLQMIELN